MKKHDNQDEEIEITTTDKENLTDLEADLTDVEADQTSLIKKLKQRIKELEAEKRELLEDTQRTKADFLNARRRLEEERQRDQQRQTNTQVEDLIPLADSFELAMSNQEAWQSVDETWRRGVEGIYAQLQSLLSTKRVSVIKSLGQPFDPKLHDALSTEATTDETKHDTVLRVIQSGYEIKHRNDTTEVIRPARVIIGHYTKTN